MVRSVVDVNEPPKYEGLAHERTNEPTHEIGGPRPQFVQESGTLVENFIANDMNAL